FFSLLAGSLLSLLLLSLNPSVFGDLLGGVIGGLPFGFGSLGSFRGLCAPLVVFTPLGGSLLSLLLLSLNPGVFRGLLGGVIGDLPFGFSGLGFLFGFRGLCAPLVFGFLGRLTLGAGLFLALLRRLLQNVQALLGFDRERRVRIELDEFLK